MLAPTISDDAPITMCWTIEVITPAEYIAMRIREMLNISPVSNVPLVMPDCMESVMSEMYWGPMRESNDDTMARTMPMTRCLR